MGIISPAQARRIASFWKGSSGSSLHQFTQSGEVDSTTLADVDKAMKFAGSSVHRQALTHLRNYLQHRMGKGETASVPGWGELQHESSEAFKVGEQVLTSDGQVGTIVKVTESALELAFNDGQVGEFSLSSEHYEACSACNRSVDESWKFCGSCGHDLVEDHAAELADDAVVQVAKILLDQGFSPEPDPTFGVTRYSLGNEIKDLRVMPGNRWEHAGVEGDGVSSLLGYLEKFKSTEDA